MAKWLLRKPDGGFHQVLTKGSAKPSHVENPDDLPYVKVSRHTNDPHAEHYDWDQKRWVKNHEHRASLDEATKYAHLSRAEFFRLMEEMVQQRLDEFVAKGGAK